MRVNNVGFVVKAYFKFILLKNFELCFSVRVTVSANLRLGSCSKSPGHYILKFVHYFKCFINPYISVV